MATVCVPHESSIINISDVRDSELCQNFQFLFGFAVRYCELIPPDQAGQPADSTVVHTQQINKHTHYPQPQTHTQPCWFRWVPTQAIQIDRIIRMTTYFTNKLLKLRRVEHDANEYICTYTLFAASKCMKRV